MTIDMHGQFAYNVTVKRALVLIFVCLLLAAVAGLAYPLVGGSLAQIVRQAGEEERYFPETGHLVAGEFLRTYESVPDPELVFGYPITEAFTDVVLERTVQYFERARFELFPENPPELRIKVSELGYLTRKAGPTLPIPGNLQACRTFDEVEYPVCFAFLEFFESHGGVRVFGYPISSFELHDGRIAQYFQRARFEWHPEKPAGQRVVLTKLGRKYFEINREDPIRLMAITYTTGSNLPQRILTLQVRAYARQTVTPKQGTQIIDVLVQDQTLAPVAGADVYLEIRFTDGTVLNTIVPSPTDEQGLVSYTLDFPEQRVGVVLINVQAVYDGLHSSTLTSFRVW